MDTEVVLWEADGRKHAPIVYDVHIFYDHAKLLIAEKIMLDNRGRQTYKACGQEGQLF